VTGVLVLASRSPRRQVLLRLLVDVFTVDAVPVDESAPLALPVPMAVQAIARKKALAASRKHPGAWVLAADTVAVRDERLVGKARDPVAERATLADLAGREHRVVTGLALAWDEEIVDDDAATTWLRMDRLPRATVDAYVESGAWQGKAGGYGIQDRVIAPHVRILRGAWSNVVGLPLAATAALLRRNRLPCKDPPEEAWLQEHNPFDGPDRPPQRT